MFKCVRQISILLQRSVRSPLDHLVQVDRFIKRFQLLLRIRLREVQLQCRTDLNLADPDAGRAKTLQGYISLFILDCKMAGVVADGNRSEERRVGKESREAWVAGE